MIFSIVLLALLRIVS